MCHVLLNILHLTEGDCGRHITVTGLRPLRYASCHLDIVYLNRFCKTEMIVICFPSELYGL